MSRHSGLFYDGLGRRLAKEYDPHVGAGLVPAQSGVKRTEYVYDGLDPSVEYSLWNKQRDEFYRGAGAQLLTLRHFPAGTAGQSYWYHLDGRGSVSGITKQQGQSTHNYRYDAYGQLLPAHGNWTDPHNHYTFSGKEWDEHLDSYEFGYRQYDPAVGVWLTQDPLRGEPSRPRTLHRYQYVAASPISYRDAYGLWWRLLSRMLNRFILEDDQHLPRLSVSIPAPTYLVKAQVGIESARRGVSRSYLHPQVHYMPQNGLHQDSSQALSAVLREHGQARQGLSQA